MIDIRGARWRTSTYTSGGNDCVEVADLAQFVAVRDSKNPAGTVLAFQRRSWGAFAEQVKAGGFDRG